MTQNSPHRGQITVERATGLHTQCRKSFKPWSHQGQLIHGACLYKVGILYCSDHPSSRVRGVAPGQGAQKREREMLNAHPPSNASSTCLTSSLITLASFLNFLPPPPHLRHFHLCSLGPSQEYEMATRMWGCIRSPWFFEIHLKSRSGSHSTQSSEIRVKGN